jgi:hypothetical protein
MSSFRLQEDLREILAKDGMNLPVRLGSSCLFPTLVLLLPFFKVLAATKSQIYERIPTKSFEQTQVIRQSSDASST